MHKEERAIPQPIQVGDVVRFRLGEREEWVCPHPECGYRFFNSEAERAYVALSSRLFRVIDVEHDSDVFQGSSNCAACDGPVGNFTLEGGQCVLSPPLDHGDLPKVFNHAGWSGFVAFEREVTLVDKNEMYQVLYS